VRLASFNLLHGRSPQDDRVDLDRLAAAIRELDPDILALQEVDRDQPRSHRMDLTALAAEVMGARSQRFVAAIAGTPGSTWIAATGDEQPGAATYGIGLLSRYDADAWQVIRLPPISVRFPMWLPGPRKIVMVHEEPRVAVAACFDTPCGRVSVVNTHLSFVPGWNHHQLARLGRDLRQRDDPVLLMGDLNTARPRAPGFRSLVAAPTFPVDAPTRQLDHILVRGRLGDHAAGQAIRLPLSDHRALICDVE
jgi:endonuclease/exonuclease/phosphatase family metal-dependent hydrolase